MRKLVLLVSLAVFLFSFACVSSADDVIDFSSFTTDELVAMRDIINKELAARNSVEKEVTVPVGIYTVGTDIPAGSYMMKCDENLIVHVLSSDNKLMDSYFGQSTGAINKLYESHENGYELVTVNNCPFVTLEDGFIVEVVNTPAVFVNLNDKVPVVQGKYTIGVDIPSGVYTVAPVGPDSSFLVLRVWSQSGEVVVLHRAEASETIGKMEISDGQTLDIMFGSALLSPFVGLGY